MEFDLERIIGQLRKTPHVLDSLLYGVSFEWVTSNEGKDTWSAYDVMGHLNHGERTDWMPRIEIIMDPANKGKGKFVPFDRKAHLELEDGRSMGELLHEFQNLRRENVEKLEKMHLGAADMAKTGVHPNLGTVTLQELLTAWVAHDLSHLCQISRVLAKQLSEDVGPWKKYLKILK